MRNAILKPTFAATGNKISDYKYSNQPSPMIMLILWYKISNDGSVKLQNLESHLPITMILLYLVHNNDRRTSQLCMESHIFTKWWYCYCYCMLWWYDSYFLRKKRIVLYQMIYYNPFMMMYLNPKSLNQKDQVWRWNWKITQVENEF